MRPWWRAWWGLVHGTAADRPREKIWFGHRDNHKGLKNGPGRRSVIRTNRNRLVTARAKGVGPPPGAASSAARSQRVQLHHDKLWAHTSTCGWPTRRVGLNPELIPDGCVTFTDDSRRWQLPGHSTGRTCELTSGSFAEGGRGQLQRQCAS